MPKVSVIMSVYNELEEWLRIAIRSILDQTFTDFEFIIINDNPNNSTNKKVLKEYAEEDGRIVVITNEENIGLTRSLNKGLRIAKGEYIARMDADDMSLPKRFERQVEYLDNNPEILCVGSWVGHIDDKGDIIEKVVRYEPNYKWVRALFIQNSQISHPAAMFHRIINSELIQYDESVRYAQDYSLMVNILQYGEITNMPEVLLHYRHSDIRISASKLAEQQEYAFKAQKKAFVLLGFNSTQQFLELYHDLTIKHERNKSYEIVVKEFKSFFRNNRLSKQNILALELIFSNYLSSLKYLQSNSWIKTAGCILRQNTFSMHILGIGLLAQLLVRKIKRIF